MFQTAMFLELMEVLCKKCYDNSKAKGFWTGTDNDNIPTKIALMHSELSELLEAFRKGNPECDKDCTVIDPKCATKEDPIGSRRLTSMEEEVADIMIRLADFCGGYNIDLGQVTLAKMRYNSTRPHMHGGKKC